MLLLNRMPFSSGLSLFLWASSTISVFLKHVQQLNVKVTFFKIKKNFLDNKTRLKKQSSRFIGSLEAVSVAGAMGTPSR